uniref:TMV resistance protein N-like n=1 Tax=Fragaria vesca subsp. vesca TaxID=101020 RepID=UPI0005CB2394|nr:PREDICTED: TMV resistance protein N-like [Fragaria vesca subsp. vesca]
MFNPFQLLQKRACVPTGLSLACLSGLHSLTTLDLSDCNLSEEAIPSDFGCSLASLEILDLSNNQFIRLLESIGQLSRLESLHLKGCRKLQTLPEFRSDVYVDAHNCISLDTLDNQTGQCDSVLQANCVNCFKMVENDSYKSNAISLLTRYLKFQRWSSSVGSNQKRFEFILPGNEIPEWYNHQSVGRVITLELDPGWFTNKFMGFTTCVVFRMVKLLPPAVYMLFISMFLKINGASVEHGYVTNFKFGEKCDQPKLDHIWFYYIHRHTYPYVLCRVAGHLPSACILIWSPLHCAN